MFKTLKAKYDRSRTKSFSAWNSGDHQLPDIATAARMLNMPYELLYDLQSDHADGKTMQDIIAELRK